METPLLDIEEVTEQFAANRRIHELTDFLTEVLKDNQPEDRELQTRLIELNLQYHPQIAEQLLQANQLTAFDKDKVARLCEKAGLSARALQLSSREADIKRILLFTKDISTVIPQNLVLKAIQHLDEASMLDVLTQMLSQSKKNAFLAYKIAEQSVDRVKVLDLINTFEAHWTSGNCLSFLAKAQPYSKDRRVHLKYVEESIKVGRFDRNIVEDKFFESVSYLHEEEALSVINQLMERSGENVHAVGRIAAMQAPPSMREIKEFMNRMEPYWTDQGFANFMEKEMHRVKDEDAIFRYLKLCQDQ